MGVEGQGMPDDLEQYRFIRVLGSGGLATAYLVEDRLKLRPAVMKVANTIATAVPRSSTRFRFSLAATRAACRQWMQIVVPGRRSCVQIAAF